MVFANPVRNKTALIALLFVFGLATCIPDNAHADQSPETSTTLYGHVIRIEEAHVSNVAGTQVTTPVQTIDVSFKLPDGIMNTAKIENDYTQLSAGDGAWISRNIASDGSVTYEIFQPDRTPVIVFFTALFLVLLFAIGGWQGVRGLATLAGSLVLIIYVLIPSLLHGFSPVLLSIGVASLIIVLGSYITHGFNRTTTSAVVGMIITVIVTGMLSWSAVHFGKLSGSASEESTYLNIATNGTLDMAGLLLGAILIGLLGVLYDVAIGQAVAVEELFRAHAETGSANIFSRAMRMGREHIGALVNTLAIAYVGAALPLLLLFVSGTHEPFILTVNREIFATEILRTLVGSIGLILAVPITTLVAVKLLAKVDFSKIKNSHH